MGALFYKKVARKGYKFWRRARSNVTEASSHRTWCIQQELSWFIPLSNAFVHTGLFYSAWNAFATAVETIYSKSISESEALHVEFSAIFKSLYILISPTPRRSNLVSLLCGLTTTSLDGIIRSDGAALPLYVEHLDLMMRDIVEVLQENSSLTEVGASHLKTSR